MMGTIMPLIFGIGLVLLVMYLYRNNFLKVYKSKFGEQNNALDILQERYARGEINNFEYESKKQDLQIREESQ